MSLVEIVEKAITREMDDLANQIEGELKAEIHPHHRSGDAEGSIHIEAPSEHVRRIGSDNLHWFFLDQGNNQSVSVIRPKKARSLRFSDGTFHKKAKTYSGFHIARKVADRHR